jgi:hypothetical protein
MGGTIGKFLTGTQENDPLQSFAGDELGVGVGANKPTSYGPNNNWWGPTTPTGVPAGGSAAALAKPAGPVAGPGIIPAANPSQWMTPAAPGAGTPGAPNGHTPQQLAAALGSRQQAQAPIAYHPGAVNMVNGVLQKAPG